MLPFRHLPGMERWPSEQRWTQGRAMPWRGWVAGLQGAALVTSRGFQPILVRGHRCHNHLTQRQGAQAPGGDTISARGKVHAWGPSSLPLPWCQNSQGRLRYTVTCERPRAEGPSGTGLLPSHSEAGLTAGAGEPGQMLVTCWLPAMVTASVRSLPACTS